MIELPGENHTTNQLWTEKYRISSLDEFVGQEQIVKILKSYEQKPIPQIPPMLFYGSYGLGKTAMARAFMPDLPMFHDNSAKDRGVQYAKHIDKMLHSRMTIFQFLSSPNEEKPRRTDGIKIIIDEAEQIINEAQIMLRDSVERGGYSAVVIMITNDLKKINEGLKERFPLKLEFKSVEPEKMRNLARRIIEAENVNISSQDLEKIVKVSTGIPRRLIQHLNLYADTGTLPEERESLNDYK